MKKLFFTLPFALAFVTATSQTFTPCYTDQLRQEFVKQHPESLEAEKTANQVAREQVASIIRNKKTGIKIIPVVFHVIHQNGTENISQTQIMDQIRILNEDYRKKAGTNGGSSTDALAADMEIEFRLAQYDPNGNKSDGINRIYSSQTNNATDAVKSLSYWSSSRYLNIWVVKSISNTVQGSGQGTILGYAQFPFEQPTAPLTDGVVVRSDYVGMIGNAVTSGGGRTLTHEIGHWLGLYHPFQGGCVDSVTEGNCAYTDDQVCDTPPVSDPNYGSCVARNSCSNDIPDLPDLVKNYMDYADGSCMNMFTSGQKTRIYGISFAGGNYRGTATSVSNLNKAGLDADGNYLPVTASSIKAPYYYDFENSSIVADGWKYNNFNNPDTGWQATANAAFNGSKSVYIPNYIHPKVMVGSRDGFQSPEIDISTLADPYVNFYYAYVQKSSVTTDALKLTISNDFGMNEASLFNKSGSTLSTTGSTQPSSEFVPQPAQWKKVSISLSAYKTYTNARFRFEFVNYKGNNAYVDYFSITDGAFNGIDDNIKSTLNFEVFPNPMSETAVISFELQQKEQVKITLLDLMGREVLVAENSRLESGPHSLNISKNGLKSGIYFIRVEAGENRFNHKLLIN